MKLEKNSNSMLFSSTEIPDVFFTEYMSQANGDFIKVYLCLLFLSKYDKDINLNDLSKKLDIPLQKIKESLVYWEAQGVLTKKVDGYILNNLQEVELHKLYSPNLTLSAEDVKKNSDNKYRAQAIE
ncbi:MAG: DNA replication protein DnaD, partial [Clostridia bacterium]